MAKVMLIEGPVGAGKSTYAKALGRRINAPHLNLDAWMSRLFTPDRPATDVIEWYLERKERCINQIWETAISILESGSDVILELGLIQAESRNLMYRKIEDSGIEFQVYVLEAAKDTRWRRVQLRNATEGSTFSMTVSNDVFEMASNLWEAPDEHEMEEQSIIFVSQTESDNAFKSSKQ